MLRLSRDGITEISSYGMRDFFRDNMSSLVNSDKIIGGWDIHNKNYVVSLQKSNEYHTLSFDEDSKGWTSFFDYRPSHLLSLDASFYSTNEGELWLHHAFSADFDQERGVFYGNRNNSNVTFVFNNEQSLVKTFKTINYEGNDGWEVESITTPSGLGLRINKASSVSESRSTLADMQSQLFSNNFKRKENKYFANIVNSSQPEPGQIVFGSSSSGVKGFFATVKMSVDNTLTGKKELFAVSTNYTESSY